MIIPAAGIAGEAEYRALVPGDLISAAQANPDQTFQVIVQGDPERGKSDEVAEGVRSEQGNPKRIFSSITGVSAEMSGKDLLKLARHPHVTAITRDAPVSASYTYAEMWRESTKVSSLYDTATSVGPTPPAIAIIDSGIDGTKVADFGNRIVASVNFSSLSPGTTADASGHGTMVAGVAAGEKLGEPGAAPKAPLVNLRVANEAGEALTSDIIAAIDWVIANKGTYNIRVANLSLAGTQEASIMVDPLDRAVEKLWLNNVVVVAAVGNHGGAGAVKIPAPANDPFIITAGAVHQKDTSDAADDLRAIWSAYGYTADGFLKPELVAPGRFMIMPVPAGSTIPLTKPERIVSPGYMWMSGTSFAAPIVAGAAAQILARHPEWTADQVKGALMLTTTYLGEGTGVGEINAEAAAALTSPPNPNENLYAFVKSSGSGGELYFDASAWSAHVALNSNWTSSNWTSSNWTSSNWVSSNWVSSNWTSSNWVSSNWTQSNWVQSNWVQAGWPD